MPSTSATALPGPAFAAPSGLAWRVIGLACVYRLLIPPVLLVIQRRAQPTGLGLFLARELAQTSGACRLRHAPA